MPRSFQVVLSGGMRQLVARFLADAFAADSEASPTPTAEMLRRGEGLPVGTIPVRANTLVIGGEPVPFDDEAGAAAAHERAGPWSCTFFGKNRSSVSI